MSTVHPAEELAALTRAFGPGAARRKEALLDQIAAGRALSPRRLRQLHDSLYFLRAYPDGPRVLRRVEELALTIRERVQGLGEAAARLDGSGLPGSCQRYAFSYHTVLRLEARFPGSLDLDWDELEETGGLLQALACGLTPAEQQALDDEDLSLTTWLDRCRSREEQTDLQLLLELLAGSSLSRAERARVYDSADLPCAFQLREPGSGRCEVALRPRRMAWQRRPVSREHFPLPPRIRRPLSRHRRVSRARGEALLDLATRALALRNLEIVPLLDGNPEDVTVVEGPRGLQLMLAGVLPGCRAVLEALHFFMVLKNGVPIAYGPVGTLLGAAELGINLFPEFRGGEIRVIYALLFQALYHLAGARYFYLTPYGMGRDNDEALQSGAFWFYRKLGFRAANPEVEALAQGEEARMRKDPTHRSNLAMLRRLSSTSVYLDLSGGRCPPLSLATLGLATTRLIQERHGGDRRRARISCTCTLRRVLELGDLRRWSSTARESLGQLAPVLCLLEDLESWPVSERKALGRLVRARGRGDEYGYLRQAQAHPRLGPALRALAGPRYPGTYLDQLPELSNSRSPAHTRPEAIRDVP